MSCKSYGCCGLSVSNFGQCLHPPCPFRQCFSFFMRTWFVSASVGVLAVCCLCSLSLFHVRVPRVPFTGLQKYVPRFAFHIAVLGRSLLWLCAVAVVYPVETVVQTKRPIYAIKQWLGSIMEGLLII